MPTIAEIDAQFRYGVQHRFECAKKRLDRAHRAVGDAESELIQAQREYNDASRDFTDEFFRDRTSKRRVDSP